MRKRVELPSLRGWQKEAKQQFLDSGSRDWLTVATPGAGKTTYALSLARHMMERGFVKQVLIVAPTDHLRSQWVGAADRFGLDLRATPNDGHLPKEADGCVVTYAQVAAAPQLHTARCRNTPSMVIFDEVHHAGDSKSWGSSVILAFESAVSRLHLTGTPFRSDDAQIAHITYTDTAEGLVSQADYTYGYAEALRDGVVRPVVFAAYTGFSEWVTSAGEARQAVLGDPELSKATEDGAWRAALDADGEWIPHVMAAAWDRVRRMRATTMPDAAVLIPASSQEQARQYADVWRLVTGQQPLVALSDDPTAGKVIAEFRDNPEHTCLVCVRLVTEGVDIPRCAVLVWATTASTPLFFAQMVGRVVRARSRSEKAVVFLPAVSRLLGLAASMELERNHVIDPPTPADPGQLEPEAGTELDDVPTDDEPAGRWQAVSSRASFQQVVDTTSGLLNLDDDAADLFGMEGLLTAEQEAALLARDEAARRQQAAEAAKARRAAQDAESTSLVDEIRRRQQAGLPFTDEMRRQMKQPSRAHKETTPQDESARLRSRITRMVAAYAQQKGMKPPEAWQLLYRRTPGPKNPAAGITLLQRREQMIRTMLDS